MNLAVFAPLWVVLVLAAFLAAAAVEDGLRLRISNITCIAVTMTAIIGMVLLGPKLALWQNLLVFAAVLVIGTMLFSAGKLGGGDVKLFAAVGLWFDLKGSLALISCIFIAGGLLALIVISARFFPPKRSRLGPMRKGAKIPYGIAICAGALFAIFWSRQIHTAHIVDLPNWAY